MKQEQGGILLEEWLGGSCCRPCLLLIEILYNFRFPWEAHIYLNGEFSFDSVLDKILWNLLFGLWIQLVRTSVTKLKQNQCFLRLVVLFYYSFVSFFLSGAPLLPADT
jgi:hypothetical protein